MPVDNSTSIEKLLINASAGELAVIAGALSTFDPNSDPKQIMHLDESVPPEESKKGGTPYDGGVIFDAIRKNENLINLLKKYKIVETDSNGRIIDIHKDLGGIGALKTIEAETEVDFQGPTMAGGGGASTEKRKIKVTYTYISPPKKSGPVPENAPDAGPFDGIIAVALAKIWDANYDEFQKKIENGKKNGTIQGPVLVTIKSNNSKVFAYIEKDPDANNKNYDDAKDQAEENDSNVIYNEGHKIVNPPDIGGNTISRSEEHKNSGGSSPCADAWAQIRKTPTISTGGLNVETEHADALGNIIQAGINSEKMEKMLPSLTTESSPHGNVGSAVFTVAYKSLAISTKLTKFTDLTLKKIAPEAADILKYTGKAADYTKYARGGSGQAIIAYHIAVGGYDLLTGDISGFRDNWDAANSQARIEIYKIPGITTAGDILGYTLTKIPFVSTHTPPRTPLLTTGGYTYWSVTPEGKGLLVPSNVRFPEQNPPMGAVNTFGVKPLPGYTGPPQTISLGPNGAVLLDVNGNPLTRTTPTGPPNLSTAQTISAAFQLGWYVIDYGPYVREGLDLLSDIGMDATKKESLIREARKNGWDEGVYVSTGGNVILPGIKSANPSQNYWTVLGPDNLNHNVPIPYGIAYPETSHLNPIGGEKLKSFNANPIEVVAPKWRWWEPGIILLNHWWRTSGTRRSLNLIEKAWKGLKDLFSATVLPSSPGNGMTTDPKTNADLALALEAEVAKTDYDNALQNINDLEAIGNQFLAGNSNVPDIPLQTINGDTSIILNPSKADPNWNGQFGSISGPTSYTGPLTIGCFSEDVLIHTIDGERKISDLKIGDTITSFDSNGNLFYEDTIVKTFIHHDKNIFRYIFANGNYLDVTDDHPILTPTGVFSKISDVGIGGSGVDLNGETVEIIEKRFLRIGVVYNIEVENNETYIANGIRVHNKTRNIGPNRQVALDIARELADIEKKTKEWEDFINQNFPEWMSSLDLPWYHTIVPVGTEESDEVDPDVPRPPSDPPPSEPEPPSETLPDPPYPNSPINDPWGDVPPRVPKEIIFNLPEQDPDNPRQCFPYDSKILTPFGKIKLGLISEGDEIYSFDLRGNRITTKIKFKLSHEMETEHARVFKYEMSDGNILFATKNHSILTHKNGKNTFARLDTIGKSDIVFNEKMEKVNIINISYHKTIPVYHVVPEVGEIICVDGILVDTMAIF